MKLIKELEQFAKSLVISPKIYARYGCLRPSRVKLVGCEHWVHIDTADRRAVKKFIYDPVRGRISPPRVFWDDFNKHLRPSVAVEVGVNFGECLFGVRYLAETRVFGFEANPHITPYLEKSRMEHPDGSRITIIQGLVSDEAGEDIPFRVDPTWSGGGSAIISLNPDKDTQTYQLAARTLDSVIPLDLVSGRCLLFKMDIEGYESKAFRGFDRTLDAASMAIGLIEFDSSYITAAGDSPTAYFSRLMSRFEVFRLAGSGTRTITRVHDYESMPRSRAADGRIHTDLILVAGRKDVSTWLPPGWSLH